MSLREGCYLVSFKPNRADPAVDPQTYVGTLRVAKIGDKKSGDESRLRASGDLYRFSERARTAVEIVDGWKAAATRPGEEIPVFPLSDYAYYLEVPSPIDATEKLPVLEFRAQKFDQTTRSLSAGSVCQLALAPGARTGEWTGTLTSGGEPRGEFSFRWISKILRRAQLRIFQIQPNKKNPIRAPHKLLKGAAGIDWVPIFRKIGWQLEVTPEDRSGQEFNMVNGESWAPYDLSAVGLKLRENVDNDSRWVYDLMCVSRFENEQYLGIMFDTEAVDFNRRPRESAAVAALQGIKVNGQDTVSQDAFGGRLYFRTALHEVGHAMNLAHNLRGRTLMNTTEFLLSAPASDSGSKGWKNKGFANKFSPQWGFDSADKDWLQHAPDIAVRPGGVSRHEVRRQNDGRQQVITLSFFEPPTLSLDIQPVVERFPYGAPVRLDYTLSNYGQPVSIPANISLRGGHISGRVIGPDRETRYFRSAFRCCDSIAHSDRLQKLPTEGIDVLEQGMTLLRGIDGPLFPDPGSYEIELELRWDANSQTNRVVGRANVVVDKPDSEKDPHQEMVAKALLNRPSIMPALVQGLLDEEGARALSCALNSPVLAPHYLATALKCRVMGTGRKQDWKKLLSSAALDGDGVFSGIATKLRQRDSQAAQNGALLVKVGIVHTVRERQQFDALPDKDKDKIIVKANEDGLIIAPEIYAWLEEIRDISRGIPMSSPLKGPKGTGGRTHRRLPRSPGKASTNV
jgi:hypothetical protein